MKNKTSIVVSMTAILLLSSIFSGCHTEDRMEDFVFQETTIVVRPNLVMYVTVDNRIVVWGTIESSNSEKYVISSPTVVPTISDVFALSDSYIRGKQFIIKLDGTVWEMHLDNHSDGINFAFTKVDGIENCVKISSGTTHHLALLENGVVMAWGRNDYGQLGDGTRVSKELPFVVDRLTNIVDIAAGAVNSMAVDVEGFLFFWGSDASSTPKKLKYSGSIRSIGENRFLISDGEAFMRENRKLISVEDCLTNPTVYTDIKGDIVRITSSGRLAVLTSDGAVWQKGSFAISTGPLGTLVKETLNPATDLPKAVIIAGGILSCVAVAEDGSIWEWGYDVTGQIRYNSNDEFRARCVINAEDIKGIEVKLPSL